MSTAVRILGIDPGTRVMGFGVLDVAPRQGVPGSPVHGGLVRHVGSGCWGLQGSHPARLERIFRELSAALERYRPAVVAIERVFHGNNFDSVLKLGQSRGVVLLASRLAGLTIREYAPAEVKKTLTGNGNAEKAQVQRMIVRQLGLEAPPEPTDASDALAVAFCCAESLERERRLGPRAPRRPSRAGKRKSPGRESPPQGSRGGTRKKAFLAELLQSGKAAWVETKPKKKRKGGGERLP